MYILHVCIFAQQSCVVRRAWPSRYKIFNSFHIRLFTYNDVILMIYASLARGNGTLLRKGGDFLKLFPIEERKIIQVQYSSASDCDILLTHPLSNKVFYYDFSNIYFTRCLGNFSLSIIVLIVQL